MDFCDGPREQHAHDTWLKVFSCLEFLACKHNLTWSEKLLHVPGEAEVEEERQLLHFTPLKQPFSPPALDRPWQRDGMAKKSSVLALIPSCWL